MNYSAYKARIQLLHNYGYKRLGKSNLYVHGDHNYHEVVAASLSIETCMRYSVARLRRTLEFYKRILNKG